MLDICICFTKHSAFATHMLIGLLFLYAQTLDELFKGPVLGARLLHYQILDIYCSRAVR